MTYLTTRSLLSLAVLLCLSASLACADSPAPVDLTQIDRTIVREPKYDGQPHYALLVFGMKAENRAWFVIDGDSVAYIDHNGNGDLTEPDERIERTVEPVGQPRNRRSGPYLAMHKFPLGTVFGAEFSFQLWVRDPNYDDSQDIELLRERRREFQEKGWVNGTLTRQGKDRINADNPLLLTLRPEEAQISASTARSRLRSTMRIADPGTLAEANFLGGQHRVPRPVGQGLPSPGVWLYDTDDERSAGGGTPRGEAGVFTGFRDRNAPRADVDAGSCCCGDRFSAVLRMPRNYAGTESRSR